MTTRKHCPASGKVRFRDEVAAKLAMAEINRLGNSAKAISRVYRCPQCAGFHMTSKAK